MTEPRMWPRRLCRRCDVGMAAPFLPVCWSCESADHVHPAIGSASVVRPSWVPTVRSQP